ncbi:hypothetical protein BDB00DRAFT_129523 [Zychaea mexicana]|uniref:uncharacterized protein n=1 Tax=Zychaea mexicana TaxID=64656 RepID=UPI0022FE55B7|nr:uncharacterized protein BDB00DRAFT_129523 [Zychaea mexicana]KAI9484553.1 hypothetical protein BDB00DRAFT_129523 [Zychaea mexicana]
MGGATTTDTTSTTPTTAASTASASTSSNNQQCGPAQDNNRPPRKHNRPKRKPKSDKSATTDSAATGTGTSAAAAAEGNTNNNNDATSAAAKRHRRPRKKTNNKPNEQQQPQSSDAPVTEQQQKTDQASHSTHQQPAAATGAGVNNEKKKRQRNRQRNTNSNSNETNGEGGPGRRNPKFTKHRAQGQLSTENQETDAPDGPSPSTTTKNHRPQDKGKRPRRKGEVKKKVDPKDLASSLAQDLRTASYECMVCWDVVRQGHQTWSCDCCWAVFHLSCVKQWASKSLQETETNKPVTAWRCPGCQHTRKAIPKDYICFCGKQRNPDQSRYLTPHSCDQLCKKSRNCPHECTLPCHPGPCPPCTAMGPTMFCFCGEHSRQTRCVDTDYTALGYSCDEVCGELLGCEKHLCEDKCHLGLCKPCSFQEKQMCYCGKHDRTAACGSERGILSGDHVGYYECDDICNRPFKCGQHRCQKKCHVQDSKLVTCPYDPTIVTTCPCGTTSITKLLDGANRTSCTDPIPTCTAICAKQLPCGHTCNQTCHLGECPPCEELVQVHCRCKSSTFQATCARVCEVAGGEPPLCDKICRSVRNCGRHQCKIQCCPANKQKGAKKSVRQSGTAHDCPEICGRKLSCGIHECKEPCHKGRCQPCLEAAFDEVTCHCGRTRLEPPVRCGTKLPPCPHPCIREAPCGHVRLVQHPCHLDSEPCPPCVMLVARKCVCGKTDLKNVPCYRGSPRCGRVCEKPLACGRHRCTKTCHAGPCLAEGEACVQICNGKRAKCDHPCAKKCHGLTPCPENDPCQTMVQAACKCGQHALQVACNATSETMGSKRELSCNDFCAKVERNRRLASALEIERDVTPASSSSPSSSGIPLDEAVPSTDELGYYDDSLCEFYLENLRWCKQMETMLIDFVKDQAKHVLHCKPMKSGFRKFIHRYSVHFNVSTESVDPEPYRSVVVRKSLGQPRIPSPLLSVAAHHPSMNRPPPPNTTAGAKSSSSSKQPVNALCLSDLAFGLIKSELDMELAEAFGDGLKFTSEWLTDADAVLVVPTVDDYPIEEREGIVWELKKLAKDSLTASGNAARIDCCWVDKEGKITWTERKQLIRHEGELSGHGSQQQRPSSSSSNMFDALSSSSDEGWMRVTKETADNDAWDQEPIVKEKSSAVATGTTAGLTTPEDWEDLGK